MRRHHWRAILAHHRPQGGQCPGWQSHQLRTLAWAGAMCWEGTGKPVLLAAPVCCCHSCSEGFHSAMVWGEPVQILQLPRHGCFASCPHEPAVGSGAAPQTNPTWLRADYFDSASKGEVAGAGVKSASSTSEWCWQLLGRAASCGWWVVRAGCGHQLSTASPAAEPLGVSRQRRACPTLIKTLFSTSPWQSAKKSSFHARGLNINPILGFRSSRMTKWALQFHSCLLSINLFSSPSAGYDSGLHIVFLPELSVFWL